MSIACDAQSLINAAYSAGYAKLSMRDLKEAILAAACSNSGGGGGSGCLIGGVGPPAGDPPCDFSIYIQGPGLNYGLWLGFKATGWGNVIAQGP